MCMMPRAAVGGGVQAMVEYGRPFMHEVILGLIVSWLIHWLLSAVAKVLNCDYSHGYDHL